MTDLTDAPIFLIGYRGTGKTTLAQLLAARLGWDWVDADVVVEAQVGKSIAAIFADDGEAAFRDLEAQAVAELCRRTRTVVGLGGGAVLREESCRAIQAAGPVVWLTASVETIQRRMAADASTQARRPNLTSSGGRAEIESVLAQRMPIYRACATLVVDTEGKEPSEVADEIVAHLNANS
jgi:shikimate kinase